MPRLEYFHLPSLMFIVAAGALAVSVLLALQWRGNRRGTYMLLWSLAFGLGSIGAGVQAMRGILPKFAVVGIANTLLCLTMALIWSGLRAFDGRPIRVGWLFAGSLVWLAACSYPPFYASFDARTTLASLLLASYSLAIVVHEWRQHIREPLPSRPAVIGLFGIHVVIVTSRIPMLFLFPVAEIDGMIHSSWFGAYIAESVIQSFLIIVALLALARDRIERDFRRAAETDALTGVANRRAFVAEAEERIAATGAGALLLLDIDYFKTINDSHGHQAGDQVLAGFAARAAACLSAGHLFGRIGGEEFAVFLPDADGVSGRDLAEYLRDTIANTPFLIAGRSIRITVSIGVASVGGGATRFERLFALADAALYRAKSAGRNRVRTHEAPSRRGGGPLQAVAG